MGKLNNCTICERPVLALDGQYEEMDSYFVAPDDELLLIAGQVHTKCLASCPLRQAWVRTMLRYYTVRHYRVVQQTSDWTILRNRDDRNLVAYHVDGESIHLPADKPKTSRTAGGATLELELDYYLTLEDRDLVAELQRELNTAKAVPLAKLADALELRDTLWWPGVLERGALVYSRKLLDGWTSTSIGARVTYARFVPDVVLAAWKAARRATP